MVEIPITEFVDRSKTAISELYPELTPEQQAEAEFRMRGYLAIAKRIFERICSEEPNILTELERRAKLRKEKKGF